MQLRVSVLIVALCLSWSAATASKPTKKDVSVDLRTKYLASLAQGLASTNPSRTSGSLWSPYGQLVDGAADYKAHNLNDIVTIVVSVQTTAAQSGSVDSSRDFSHTSALTGLLGQAPAAGNPLFAGNSSTSLKGSGATASNTAFSTGLSGQVIAVLPNGNLVLEAHRQIAMNNQHEEVIVRGVARIGDITPSNTVPSTALSSLEIELKGKGIISQSVRPPNPITRALLWLFGF
jgi:flagellar L-ring protein precursor FlgH